MIWKKKDTPELEYIPRPAPILPSDEELRDLNDLARERGRAALLEQFENLSSFGTFHRCPKCDRSELRRTFGLGRSWSYKRKFRSHRWPGLGRGVEAFIDCRYVDIPGHAQMEVTCVGCGYLLGCEKPFDGKSGLE